MVDDYSEKASSTCNRAVVLVYLPAIPSILSGLRAGGEEHVKLGRNYGGTDSEETGRESTGS